MRSASHLAAFGRQLRALRIEKQISLRELAKRAGMHHPNIAALEAGRLPVGETTARRLAHALVLSADAEERLVLSLVRPKAQPSRGGFPSTLGIIMGAQLRRVGIEVGNLSEFIRAEIPAPFENSAPFTFWIAVEKDCALPRDLLRRKAMALLKHQGEVFVLLFVARKNGQVAPIMVTTCPE